MASETDVVIQPVLHYRDPERALGFLKEAFGFREHVVHRDDDGAIVFVRAAAERAGSRVRRRDRHGADRPALRIARLRGPRHGGQRVVLRDLPSGIIVTRRRAGTRTACLSGRKRSAN
jgi:hypothetical protein